MKKCISFLLSFVFAISFFTTIVQAKTDTIVESNNESALEVENTDTVKSNEEEVLEDGQAESQVSNESEDLANTNILDEDGKSANNEEVNIDNYLNNYKEKNKTSDNFGKEYELKESEKIKINRNSNELSKLMEDKDFVEGYEADLNSEVLVNMTNDKYEVAAAKKDGSYIFIDSSDSYTESMKIAKNFNNEVNSGNATEDTEYIPCIVDKSGIVVYSVTGIARAIKYINGKYDSGTSVSYLYENSKNVGNEKLADSYINAAYCEDAPIIDSTDKAIKVMVNGYVGWAKKDIKDGNYDFTIVPINQAVNLSYYYVQNNQLYHYISSDITKSDKGNTLCIGVAPSYLRTGVKYYSYDAHYFYTDVLTLTSDLQNGTTKNAVNADSEFYNYYQYLPVRSKTSYTAAQINSFFNQNTPSNSKLRGTGDYLVKAQKSYGVNAGITLAVAMNESAKGTSNLALTKNNLFGLKAVDSNVGNATTYNSVEGCINDFAKSYISKNYCNPNNWVGFGGFLGNKAVGINVKYASDPYWGEKASQYYFMFDKWASNFNSNGYKISDLLDYNNYTIGVYCSPTTVKFSSNNNTAYSVAAKKATNYELVGGTVIIDSVDSANSRYNVVPTVSSVASKDFNGMYTWDIPAYVPKSAIKIVNEDSTCENSKIQYKAYVQSIGWQQTRYDGEVAGTVGQSKRMEAISISLNDYKNANIKYRAYVEGIGWQNWVSEGQVAGTTEQAKRMEAFEITASGLPSNMELQYRVQVQRIGWQDWKRSGETAGTIGQNLRIESIQIRIVSTKPSVQYNSHVQSIGWQGYKTDGQTSGTTGEAKRIEAFRANLVDYPGASINYRAYVQDKGWQNIASNGSIAGTIGESKRIEAIQISTEGLPKEYKVQYRVHVQGIGWQNWVSEGEIAGTIGESKRIEAIEVSIVKEVGKTPKVQYRSHIQSIGWQDYVEDGQTSGTTEQAKRMEAFQAKILDCPGANISYRAHVQSIGWQDWVSNGLVAGTEGQAKRVEALELKTTGLPAGYKLKYRAYVQRVGWQDWVSEGETAGTEGKSLRIEAIEIKIVHE